MTLTGKGLADFAISKIGTPYFYGSKFTKLTESFMTKMHNSYPKTVTNAYMQKARDKKMLNKVCVDCSGLIGGYRKSQIGSAQLYKTAAKRLPIRDIAEFPIGTVLWKEGHVGVYIGGGYCVEAKGINYGTIKSKVSSTKWVYGLLFKDISYEETSKELNYLNPYTCPKGLVGIKYKGTADEVKWIQVELNESGYSIEIDGIFGKETEKAVKKFQKSCKIEEDGIVGPDTIKHLKMLK